MILLLLLLLLLVVVCCKGDNDSTSSSSSSSSSFYVSPYKIDGRQRYIVLFVTRLGLANRLRAIADWYVISLLTDRILLINWIKDVQCNIKFDELFEAVPKGLRLLPYQLPPSRLDLVQDIANDLDMTSIIMDDSWKISINSNPDEHGFVLKDDYLKSNINVIITNHVGLITLEGIPCQQYMMMRSKFYSLLKPVSFVRQSIEDIHEKYFSKHLMIGIHYRAYEASLDWQVVPPRVHQTEANKFGQGANELDFEIIMKMIDKRFTYTDKNGIVHKQYKFYIATNSPESKDYFHNSFPETAVSINETLIRSSSRGGLYSLIDFLMLSQSHIIINTYGSSFGTEASQVRFTPLLSIWDGIVVHHMNTALQYCGHMQYLRSYGLGKVSTFTEPGTVNNRIVNATFVNLWKCNYYKDLGFDDIDIFCPTIDSGRA